MENSLIQQAQLSDLRTIAEQAGAQFCNGHSACPLHHGTNPQQFHVWRGDDGKERWTCFGDCNESGDVIDFVMRLHGLSFIQAVERLTGGAIISQEELAAITIERAERAAREAEQAAAKARQAVQELRETHAWIKFHEALTDDTRRLWSEAGIPDWYVDYVKLGYAAHFSLDTQNGRWITPALSMPHYTDGWEVANVALRLLNPPTPKDKYRPLKSGIAIPPFIADPDKMYNAENFLVVEGQKKAACTWCTIESDKWQVIGVKKGTAGSPQKKDLPPSGQELAEKLKSRHIVVCLDPDAQPEAQKLARCLGGRVVLLPQKIDDMIVTAEIGKNDLINLINQSRREL